MYTREDLHKLISSALEGWLSGTGQVFTVGMTPKQRESLLELLAPRGVCRQCGYTIVFEQRDAASSCPTGKNE